MLKPIVLLAISLILSVELSPILAQSSSSNPIMIIRCRFDANQEGIRLKESAQKVEENCPETTDLQPITFYDGTKCVPVCFDGTVALEFPDIDCTTATAGGLIETRVCFTSSDPTNPINVGQSVTFDAISNCLDAGGAEWLPDFIANSGYNAAYDEAGFGPASVIDGEVKVCATFTVDPAIAVSTNIIGGPNPSGTTVSALPCPSLAIPTIGQWGLIILGLLTSCIALAFMIKRMSKTV